MDRRTTRNISCLCLYLATSTSLLATQHSTQVKYMTDRISFKEHGGMSDQLRDAHWCIYFPMATIVHTNRLFLRVKDA